MKRYYIFSILAFFLALISCTSVYAWECDVTLNGPDVIKIGQVITLSASGTPEGGSYSWFNTPNLVPNGSTAQLTGYEPTYSEYIRVGVTYTTPKGKRCTAIKWIWACKCYVKISGPDEAYVGEPITLTAKGDPSGGAYAWTPLPGLEANGSTAQFTAEEPGEVTIEVAYTPPDAEEPCYDTHTVIVKEECEVSITGPTVVGVGNSIKLSASGAPTGGTYSWTEQPGLIPGTSMATFVGVSPGTATIAVKYVPPEGGEPCPATHDVMVFDIKLFIPPVCIDSGTTLSSSDFNIVTEPAAFEDMVIVKPLYFETLLQSEDNEVTACTGASAASSCLSKTTTVVNSDIVLDAGISIEVPNQVNDVMKMIGLGEETDLSITCNFPNFQECCVFGIARSVNGSANIVLSVSTKPLTIVGVPIPPTFKKYVSADLLYVILSGGADIFVNGNYNACEQQTKWGGGGSLKAGIEAGCMAKAEISEVLVIKGKISGSTGVTEKLSVDATNLKIATSWDGLKASGQILIIVRNFLDLDFGVSRTYLKKDKFPLFTVSLPSFN